MEQNRASFCEAQRRNLAKKGLYRRPKEWMGVHKGSVSNGSFWGWSNHVGQKRGKGHGKASEQKW